MSTNLGTDAANTKVVLTSSGDLVLTKQDRWIIADDTDSAGRPAVTLAFAGANARVRPETGHAHRRRPRDHLPLSRCRPAARTILMHFATQRTRQNEALLSAQALAALAGQALADLEPAEQADIVNFFAFPDADQDGLADADESGLGTDPNNADSDGDGLLDGFEVQNGFDPERRGGGRRRSRRRRARQPRRAAGGDRSATTPTATTTARATAPRRPSGRTRSTATPTATACRTAPRSTSTTAIRTSPTPTPAAGPTARRRSRTAPTPSTGATTPSPAPASSSPTVAARSGHSSRSAGNFVSGILSSAANLVVTKLPDIFSSSFRAGRSSSPTPARAAASCGPARVRVQGVTVTRKFFVPADDAFVRYLEIVDNPTAADLQVRLSRGSGLDSSTASPRSSPPPRRRSRLHHPRPLGRRRRSGRQGDPRMLHVFAGPNGRVFPSQVNVSTEQFGSEDDTHYDFDLTIPPGGRRIVMHFLSLRPDLTSAVTQAGRLDRSSARPWSDCRRRSRPRSSTSTPTPTPTSTACPTPRRRRAAADPGNPDSDGDGVRDGIEVRHGRNPLDPAEAAIGRRRRPRQPWRASGGRGSAEPRLGRRRFRGRRRAQARYQRPGPRHRLRRPVRRRRGGARYEPARR